jgi:aminoglycoside phosphotransferase (APT) family kinase protein
LRAECKAPRLGYAELPIAIRGGYDTQVFAFRLSGTTGIWARPLILRLLGPQHDPQRAIREQVTQNTVAALGYPAPRVLSASADPTALGGGFLVMQRLAGRPLLEERWFGMASVLAQMQLGLHCLDATQLLEAMHGRAGRDAVTLGCARFTTLTGITPDVPPAA